MSSRPEFVNSTINTIEGKINAKLSMHLQIGLVNERSNQYQRIYPEITPTESGKVFRRRHKCV